MVEMSGGLTASSCGWRAPLCPRCACWVGFVASDPLDLPAEKPSIFFLGVRVSHTVVSLPMYKSGSKKPFFFFLWHEDFFFLHILVVEKQSQRKKSISWAIEAYEIQTIVLVKRFLGMQCVHLFMYFSLCLSEQSSAVAAEILWLIELKIFTIWSLKGKVCHPLDLNDVLQLLSPTSKIVRSEQGLFLVQRLAQSRGCGLDESMNECKEGRPKGRRGGRGEDRGEIKKPPQSCEHRGVCHSLIFGPATEHSL